MDEADPQQLARAFLGLWEWAQAHAVDGREDVLRDRIQAHFGGEVGGLPVVSRALAGYQRVNFQVAIDAYLEPDRRSAELIGLPMMQGYRAGLAELVKGGRHSPWMSEGGEPGPIEYEPVDVGDATRHVRCGRSLADQ